MRLSHTHTHMLTTAYSWCDGYSTSINDCGVWEVRAEVQVSKRELQRHIHIDYIRIEFLSYIKNIYVYV